MKTFIKIITVILLAQTMQGCNLLSAAGLTSQGQPVKEVSEDFSSAQNNIVDHSQWDALLKKYVDKNGMGDYKGFQKDREDLQQYLKMLSENPPQESWSTAELLAYYINTYNAYTVELILKNYPTKSIKDLNGPWTKSFVPIGDKTLSLGGIENGILRKMDEPRIHFAINCASFSCPKLLNEAYVASKINQQLEKVTKDCINGDKNEITKNNPKLSSIFKWYKKDFKVKGEKDVIGYINQYAKVKINPETSIAYLEYNWSLNEQQ